MPGQFTADAEYTLRGGPYSKLVAFPLTQGSVGLQRNVGLYLAPVSALEDYVGGCKSRGDVALFTDPGLAHVGSVAVHLRRGRVSRRVFIHDKRQHLVFHVDGVERIFRDLRRRRCHGRNFLSRESALPREYGGIIAGQHHRLHAGQRHRPGGVDSVDPGAGMGRPQDAPVELTGQLDVGRVLGASSDLVDRVYAGVRLIDIGILRDVAPAAFAGIGNFNFNFLGLAVFLNGDLDLLHLLLHRLTLPSASCPRRTLRPRTHGDRYRTGRCFRKVLP